MVVKVDVKGTAIRLRHGGIDAIAHVREPNIAALSALMPKKLPPDTSKMLLCPMPGVITAVFVKKGDEVEIGQPLAIVEAMKMENMLRSEKKSKIGEISVEVGQSLGVDETIMEFE